MLEQAPLKPIRLCRPTTLSLGIARILGMKQEAVEVVQEDKVDLLVLIAHQLELQVILQVVQEFPVSSMDLQQSNLIIDIQIL